MEEPILQVHSGKTFSPMYLRPSMDHLSKTLANMRENWNLKPVKNGKKKIDSDQQS
jgi:hypothetical protein